MGGGCWSLLSGFGALMATSWRKSDIAVCAIDCLENCPAPVSAPIHHHLSTIRAVMICRLEIDGACCALDGSCADHGHHSSFYLVVTQEHLDEQRRLLAPQPLLLNTRLYFLLWHLGLRGLFTVNISGV